MAAAPSAQARVTLQDAFERFASTVAPDDKQLFHNTQLKDVRDEAIRIERQLRARRTQRCMARLDNFLRGMEHYSKVVEVLCNGTPFLPWIWAPVKLMLMITADSISAFEKLIEAYGKIGDIVSRLDRLGDALVNDHNFQNVLALVYSDIVEFHRRAYKFVKRKSWSIFFSSMWAGFESRFNGILKNLAYHTELADKEAAAADIAESIRRSKADDESWEQQEREWTAVKIRKVLAWLGTTDTLPADLLDRHLRDYLPHSCDWFIQHKATELWLGDSAKNPLVWLCGKPGAGKSMICSALVQHTETNGVHVFYYFCSFLGSRSDGPSRLLRSLISQVIQKHQDLAIYVHDVYFKSNPEPTKKALLTLLPELLRGLGSVRLIVDGIDEWTSRDQKELLNDLSQMISTDQSSHVCKIMVASRDTMATSRRKKDKLSTMISLSNVDEGLAVTRAIASFVNDKLSDLPEHFEELDPDSSIMAHVKKTLLEKSQGMFLWVSLVLESLDTVYSPEELRTIVDNLPSDLEALYAQIVTRLCSAPGAQSYGGVPRIMSWICFSRRPLHKSELLQALSMFPDDMSSQMRSIPVASILDHCKPLIEELPDSTIVPVHFSVKEYFLKAQIPQIVPAIDVALDISCACAIVIIRGLELVRLGSNSTDYLAIIASGNYRLLPYAIEFWIEHCLQYASGRDLHPGQALQRQLDRLHGTHETYLHALGLATIQDVLPDLVNTSHAEERLKLFLNTPIYGLMADVMGLRHMASELEGGNSSDIETYVINKDRTLFSRLAHTYESAVVYLLAQQDVQGIAPTTLRAFQESYASTAFRCRFPHCERLSLGFATAQLRLEHETTHVQRVYCETVSCQYHRIGFGNMSALNAHTKKHHGQSKILLIPAKVRRTTHAVKEIGQQQHSSQGSGIHPPKTDRIAAAKRLLRTHPGLILTIDQVQFPPNVLNMQIMQILTPDVRSWSDLKAWVQHNPSLAPGVDLEKLKLLQVLHYQDLVSGQPQSGEGEGTPIPPNTQEAPMPQQNRQDQLVINQFAKKMMDTAKPEVREKFQSDVHSWPEQIKLQLLQQGIHPLFFRFRQHAEMLYRRGALNKPAAVNTGAQIGTSHQSASKDLSGERLDSDAIAGLQVEAISPDAGVSYGQAQANVEADMPYVQDYERAPSETYTNTTIGHANPLAQSKNNLEGPLRSPYWRGSPYIPVQDSFEEDQRAPLFSISANDHPDGNNAVPDYWNDGVPNSWDDPLILGNNDFDSFLKERSNAGDDRAGVLDSELNYVDSPAASESRPIAYGDMDPQQQQRAFKLLMEDQAKTKLMRQARRIAQPQQTAQPPNTNLVQQMQQQQKAPYEQQQENERSEDIERTKEQQRMPHGTQQMEQRQRMQQRVDKAVAAMPSPSSVKPRAEGKTPAKSALTQAQKLQEYHKQLARLEEVNRARMSLGNEHRNEHQIEHRNEQERLRKQQQPREQSLPSEVRTPTLTDSGSTSSSKPYIDFLEKAKQDFRTSNAHLSGEELNRAWFQAATGQLQPQAPQHSQNGCEDTQSLSLLLHPAQGQQKPPTSSVGELRDIPLQPGSEDRWMDSDYRSPSPETLAQPREPSNDNDDWAAAVQAIRDGTAPTQESALPAPDGTRRSATDTGGIAPDMFTFGSPSPERMLPTPHFPGSSPALWTGKLPSVDEELYSNHSSPSSTHANPDHDINSKDSPRQALRAQGPNYR